VPGRRLCPARTGGAKQDRFAQDQAHHRRLRQPIARRIASSFVRSKTAIAIVFTMPIIPMISAMADVSQATALAMRTSREVSTYSGRGAIAARSQILDPAGERLDGFTLVFLGGNCKNVASPLAP